MKAAIRIKEMQTNTRYIKLHKRKIYWGWILLARVGVAFIAGPLSSSIHAACKHVNIE